MAEKTCSGLFGEVVTVLKREPKKSKQLVVESLKELDSSSPQSSSPSSSLHSVHSSSLFCFNPILGFQIFTKSKTLGTRIFSKQHIPNTSNNTTLSRSKMANHQAVRVKSTVAFAFDIDGVLVKGRTPLPGASEALQALQQKNIPFILLTNGGGKTEKDHAALVTDRLSLQIPIHENQFVQSHTPFRSLLPQFRHEVVLCLGGVGDGIRNVAQAYGFTKIVTSSDIFAAYPTIFPFAEMDSESHKAAGKCIKHALNANGDLQIAAILIWSSPRSWGVDLQICIDLLLSEKGVLHTRSVHNGNSKLPNNGYLQDGQPQIFYCNPDKNWPTDHGLDRFAQGSFKAALEGTWTSQSGGANFVDNIHHISFGKPTCATYVYGETALQAWNQEFHASKGLPEPHIDTVFMVGDNPESDIKGANSFASSFGSKWKSILVETGVHKSGTMPSQKPTMTLPNVGVAVAYGLWKNEKLQDKALY